MWQTNTLVAWAQYYRHPQIQITLWPENQIQTLLDCHIVGKDATVKTYTEMYWIAHANTGPL